MTDSNLYIITETYGWSGGARRFMRKGNQHWIETDNEPVKYVCADEWRLRLAMEPMPSMRSGPQYITITADEPKRPWWKFWGKP